MGMHTNTSNSAGKDEFARHSARKVVKWCPWLVQVPQLWRDDMRQATSAGVWLQPQGPPLHEGEAGGDASVVDLDRNLKRRRERRQGVCRNEDSWGCCRGCARDGCVYAACAIDGERRGVAQVARRRSY